MILDKHSKIFVAGHRGMVGSAMVRRLQAEGFSNLALRSKADLDLTRQKAVEEFFQAEQPDVVFVAAARVGGIFANNTYRAEFSYTNLAIQTNVIHAAWQAKVKGILFFSSSCVYPRACPQPMKEDYLFSGPPEPTKEPYDVAIQAVSFRGEIAYDTKPDGAMQKLLDIPKLSTLGSTAKTSMEAGAAIAYADCLAKQQ